MRGRRATYLELDPSSGRSEKSEVLQPVQRTDKFVPPSRRVSVVVHAPDPISRAGVVSQLHAYAELTLVDRSRQRRGQVALFVASAMDRATLRNLRALVDAEVRVALVVDGMREADVLGVVGCGVTAIVWRRAATSARLRAIRAAHQGEAHVPADLVGTLVAGLGRRKDPLTPDSAERTPIGMTPREIDVIRLVSEGFDTGEIAVKLSYSERAVKYVLQHLTSRLQLRNRSHAVAYALRAGYI